MSATTFIYSQDSNVDLFLSFIYEIRNKETEIRFAPYLQEYFNFKENTQTISKENDDDNASDDDIGK